MPRVSIVFLLLLFSAIAAASETESKIQSEVTLRPDLSLEESAYSQIQERLGKKSIESPDLFEGNHPGFEHIQIRNDREVGGCFDFFLHRDKDGDRAKEWPEGEKRQRNEIKGYAGSDDGLKATKGQVVRYSWLFRISEGMSCTRRFCHFFQLKAVGGTDTSLPLFTISASKVSNSSQLEVRTQATDKGRRKRTKVCDWESCKDKWLECECVARFDEEGYLQIAIKSLDGTIRFSTEFRNIDTWRDGSTFVRPKWGIYRSLEDKSSISSEEDVVSFTRFRVQEWSDLPFLSLSKQNAARHSPTPGESQ